MSAPLTARLRTSLTRHLKDPVYFNGYALVANAGFSAVLGFVFWILAARRFDAGALGVGAAVISAATLAALIGKAGFDAAIIRYSPSASARELKRLLLVAVLATVALTMLVALAVLFLATRGIEALAPLEHAPFAIGFLLLSVGTGIAWMLDAYYIAEQKAAVVLVRNLAFNGLKLAVPLVVAASIATAAVPLAWGLGLAASLAVLVGLLPRTLSHRAPEAASRDPLRKKAVAKYAARNYALNLSEFLPGLVFPLIVLHALGAEANARFYLAWTVAMVAFLASKAISQSAFAALVRDPSPAGGIRKGLALSAFVLTPAALALYFAAPLVLAVFGEGYRADGAGLLRLLALSIAPVAVANIYLAYLKAREAGWELTLLPAAVLAVVLAIAPLALSWGGIEGLGMLWLAAQGALGAYAAFRLLALLISHAASDGDSPVRTSWRHVHETIRTALGRRAHEG